MPAAQINLKIEKGAKYNKQFIWQDSSEVPIDLTTYSARMHIRDNIDSTNFALELTTGNGRITLGGVLGTIDLDLTATETDSLTIPDGVYDLELYVDADDVTRLMQGIVTIVEGVTR